MATEDDLRRELAATPVVGALDADAIVARSRSRRRPRQVASGLVGALALTGVLVIGLQSIPVPSGGGSAVMMESETADSSAGGSAVAPEAGASLDRQSAAGINVCAAPVAPSTGAVGGLRLEAEFDSPATSGADQITGVARITNVGTSAVTVSTSPVPAVAVSEAGTVVWHTNGPTILSLTIIELAPGESAELAATLVPVRCGPEDDALPSFPTDLPDLTPGAYEVTIAMDVADEATGTVTLLVSDPALLTLR